MPAHDDRRRARHLEELALARRVSALHALGDPPSSGFWRTAAFEHRSDTAGVTLALTEVRPDSTFRIHIAEVSGTGLVAGVLAAQCCLSRLRQTGTVDLGRLNRDFLADPPAEEMLIAAGTLHLRSEEAEWTASFAGLQAPIAVDANGGVHALRGTGPFLGMTETTFPVHRGQLVEGARLFWIAGSGARALVPTFTQRLAKTNGVPLGDAVADLGEELLTDLEPGFGLVLLGIERRVPLAGLPAPGANVE